MARFYVGQRVRIKWSRGWPELAGQIGTIVGSFTPRPGIDSPHSEWHVAPDSWGTCDAPYQSSDGGGRFGPSSDQLEPATDANDKIEWSECVWQPEHLRVGA